MYKQDLRDFGSRALCEMEPLRNIGVLNAQPTKVMLQKSILHKSCIKNYQ